MMQAISLNCDMGESFGNWTMGNDTALMPYLTAINVACGFHAGDASVIRTTVANGLKMGLQIGAHPSFPDLQGFGRRNMDLSFQEIFDCCLYQIAALKGITEALGGHLHHVKPHGALYNQAAKNPLYAQAIAQATKQLDASLVLVGLANSHSIAEAHKLGLATAAEVFADRTYQPDGSLTPRYQPHALINSVEDCLEQVENIVLHHKVKATNGTEVALVADTICLHGDGPHALVFAKALHQRFWASPS